MTCADLPSVKPTTGDLGAISTIWSMFTGGDASTMSIQPNAADDRLDEPSAVPSREVV